MESFEDRSKCYSSKAGKCQAVNTKMEELQKTKEELKQAKDEAMQSWLDSRPLLDELEKLQTNLASAKNRCSSTSISELESQLKAIHKSMRAKKEEEVRVRTMINEMTRASEKIREEMEQVKLETEEERQVRSKLKQVLRLRRQTLRTLKLTLRATRLESEAYSASAAAALHQINSHAQIDSNPVQLTQEDYYALTRRAKEEASLAEWRVAVSIEQRLVAEESRDVALGRLKEPNLHDRSSKRKIDEEIIQDRIMRETEGGSRRTRARAQTPFPKARAKLMSEDGHNNVRQPSGKSKSNTNRRPVNKNKKSIFVQIRAFLVQKIAILFR